MIKVRIGKSRNVVNQVDGPHISIGSGWRRFGIIFYPWGVRIMLVWRHICIYNSQRFSLHNKT